MAAPQRSADTPGERTIVVLTRAYPYPPGEQFILPEAPHWAGPGRRVVVMPWTSTGTPVDLPPGVELDAGLAAAVRRGGVRPLLRGLLTPLAGRELLTVIRHRRFSRSALTQTLAALRNAEITRAFLASWVAAQGPIDLVYSYWFDAWTAGALALRGRGVGAVVTRVHNYDLYQDRHPDGFHALKAQVGPRLDAVLPIAASGGQEAVRAFGVPPDRVRLARLGTVLPAQPGHPSTDGVLRVLSLSFVTPVKRVDRIATALGVLARSRPELRIEWTHLGAGPALAALAEQVVHLPPNLVVDLAGQVDPSQVPARFIERPVDLFLNTSDYEGIPVSIMEAMSFGVPVIATEVGATAELVPALGPGGMLVAASDDPTALVSAITAMIDDPHPDQHRQAARQRVIDEFDADRNAQLLMGHLDQICAATGPAGANPSPSTD